MKRKKPEQRNIFIALSTFTKLQKTYYRLKWKRPGKCPKKSEFYTEVIERGLGK